VKRVQSWFPTLIYSAPLVSQRTAQLNRDLLDDCVKLREVDVDGQKWSELNYPGGYTSYGSMDKLHHFSTSFMDLERHLNRHVKNYARSLEWDLGGRRLAMTDCWVNVMPQGVNHSLHLHPNSVVSGTYYVVTPKGCAGLKFEDPRLSNLMAAPPRKPDAKPGSQLFVTYPAKSGNVVLFESWLRHEVATNRVKAERISISFNYDWI
jgi:uncharacterized protein (TIGR02466 family)